MCKPLEKNKRRYICFFQTGKLTSVWNKSWEEMKRRYSVPAFIYGLAGEVYFAPGPWETTRHNRINPHHKVILLMKVTRVNHIAPDIIPCSGSKPHKYPGGKIKLESCSQQWNVIFLFIVSFLSASKVNTVRRKLQGAFHLLKEVIGNLDACVMTHESD